MSSTKSMLFYSLNLLFESELKGVREHTHAHTHTHTHTHTHSLAMPTYWLHSQAKYKSNINNLHSQYETSRNQTEKEEKRQMQQMGINPQDKVFSAEEVL